MTEIEEKIKFIIEWYDKEKNKFPFTKQVALANVWMEICTKNEEYEMAAAIKKEKFKLIEAYLKEKRKKRTMFERLKYCFITIKRKFT
jgi:hypothetical protein